MASVDLGWQQPKPLWVCIRVYSGIGGYFCRSYGNETEVFALYVPYIPDNVTFECVSASVIPWTNIFPAWTPKFKWSFGPEGQTPVTDPQRTFNDKTWVADNDLTPGCLGAKYLCFFSSCSLKTREKYVSFAQFVYFFEGSVFTFQFLNDKIHNYVKKNP